MIRKDNFLQSLSLVETKKYNEHNFFMPIGQNMSLSHIFQFAIRDIDCHIVTLSAKHRFYES